MIKASEIISKPILNLYNGKIEGTIKNINLDRNYKKIQDLKIFDQDEEEYTLYTNKIFNVGQNAIVIKNQEALFLSLNDLIKSENNPINMNVYTTEGNNIGKLIDIEVNDKFEIEKFITTSSSFNRNDLINIGENIIINSPNINFSKKDLKPKIRKQTTSIQNIVSILPKIETTINTKTLVDNLSSINETNLISQNNEQNQKITESNTFNEVNQNEVQKATSYSNLKYNPAPSPQKVISSINFLLGRKVLKTIYGLNNEILIKKDNLITVKTLEDAKKHSKLVELTVFSKIK